MLPRSILRAGTRTLALLLAIGLSAGGIADALAQLRPIPANAKRGELRHLQAMMVELDGKPVALSNGAQIRDADNRIVLPSALPGQVVVRYLLNAQNQISAAWILSPQELARPDPRN